MLKKYLALFLLFISTSVFAKSIQIVAAENFYGNVASEIGGSYVQVDSILNKPTQDPHLFSITPAIAKKISTANIIIYNGIDYDPWMKNFLSANHNKTIVIVVAQLMNKKTGGNPHIWYDPDTMPIFAKSISDALSSIDPSHSIDYQKNLDQFNHQYQPLLKQISLLNKQYKNTSVIATEPIFNDMADAIGLKMQGNDFQLSIMNNTAPSPRSIKQFEDALHQHQVRVLFYNNQVTSPQTERLKSIAQQEKIPIVGVSELEPLNLNYISWMQSQLSELEKALAS